MIYYRVKNISKISACVVKAFTSMRILVVVPNYSVFVLPRCYNSPIINPHDPNLFPLMYPCVICSIW